MFLKLLLCALPTENVHIMTLWCKHVPERVSSAWASSTAPALPYLRESGSSRSPPVPSLLYDSKAWRLPSDIVQLITSQEGTTECLSPTVELRQTIDKQQSKKMFGVEHANPICRMILSKH